MTTRYSSRTPGWWPVLLAIALAVYPDMATAAEDAAAPPAGGVPADGACRGDAAATTGTWPVGRRPRAAIFR